MGAVTSSRAVRLWAAVRRAPRALYEELWAAPADRVPRMEEPNAPVWRPVFLVLLVITAIGVLVIRTFELTPFGAAISGLALLVAVAQSVALVAGMIRPVGAWWAATALAFMAALVTVASVPSVHPTYPGPVAAYPTPSRGRRYRAVPCSCWRCGSGPAVRRPRWRSRWLRRCSSPCVRRRCHM